NVPKEVTVTVTASPTKGLEATLALAERLAGHGYNVVPHVSARSVVDSSNLVEIVERLRSAGIKEVFVPAGDPDTPAGPYDSALSLLKELQSSGHPFERVGITGYPESHPRIDDDLTIQAMWDKRQYADYMVSNLCFDPTTISRWIRRVRKRGVALPLYVGLAGPVEATKLLNMASKIGVAESRRFAGRHLSWFAHLGAPGGYDPSRLLTKLSATLLDPDAGVEGVHIFTFNQVQKTEAWRRSLLS
ncbi:MAG: methylenetetrahydrofolate reductase, partial [Acidimicrobiales bacterium]